MGGPIAHGVDQALRRARRGEQPPAGPGSTGTAWLTFLVATTCLSWLTAAAIGGPWFDRSDLLDRRLLGAAVYFAALMGWPPLVGAWLARLVRAERTRTPTGVRRPRLRELGIAVVLAVGLAAAAFLCARSGESRSDPMSGDAAITIAGAVAVLLVQAFIEELGWRGFPLACAIDRWGERVGLVVHGLAWGLWYAPLIVLSAGRPAESIPLAAGFVLTCLLLGIVFGWLRLRSGSVFPSMVAGAVVTIVGALPIALIGG